VCLAEGVAFDEALDQKIRMTLRQRYTPRHVPDRIYPVADIPYTLTGKKMEVPVRRILMGALPDTVANPNVMRNPEALAWFVRFAKDRADYALA
jgi:acetoacetyl-CoA synthetase